ncbi:MULTISPECIES: helix-turn-helix domain-containing protein [unclassified Streptomyces]|uniref:helix-turn-helix domain-containing protein n=1 Tax=unclassified Streptomyces TaxID=2593676 RepID=UPI00336A88D4
MSAATVSNALNGTGRLSEATRQRVFIAARELGYARPARPIPWPAAAECSA